MLNLYSDNNSSHYTWKRNNISVIKMMVKFGDHFWHWLATVKSQGNIINTLYI